MLDHFRLDRLTAPPALGPCGTRLAIWRSGKNGDPLWIDWLTAAFAAGVASLQSRNRAFYPLQLSLRVRKERRIVQLVLKL